MSGNKDGETAAGELHRIETYITMCLKGVTANASAIDNGAALSTISRLRIKHSAGE